MNVKDSRRQYPQLSDGERAWWLRFKLGGCAESRARLIEGNLRLAYKTYRRLALRLPPHSEEDAIATALLALCEAVDRFDLHHGARFSTYAVHHINGTVINYVRRVERRGAEHRSERTWEEVESWCGPATSVPDSADVALGRSMYRAVIVRAGSEFSADEWVCFQVRFLDDQPYRVLQERLGLTYSEARNLHACVQAKLQRIAREEGLLS